MKNLVLLMLLVCLPLTAANRTSLEAESVDYDGKKIRMAGAIKIAHEFGDLACNKGVILMKEGMNPERILLYGDVVVVLKDGSILASEEADINCETLEGVFRSTSPQKVEYTTRVEEDKKAVPVKTMSRSMRVTMKKGTKSEYVISDVQADGAVNIEYTQEN